MTPSTTLPVPGPETDSIECVCCDGIGLVEDYAPIPDVVVCPLCDGEGREFLPAHRWPEDQ